MAPYTKWRLWVRVWPRLGYGPVTITDYTGKLARSLLAKCSRLVEAVLEAPMGIPKPVSVSPLYRAAGGRVEALYPGSNGAGRVEYPTIHPGELLHFYLGLGPGLGDELEAILSCLKRGVDVDFSMHTLTVRLEKAEHIATYDPEQGPLVKLGEAEAVRIIFASPTLPVNPWKPRSKWKRLLPTPSYLLAVNALEATGGDARRALEVLQAAEKTLSPSPAIHETVKIRYYLHDGTLLPALTGYAKLHVEEADQEDLETTEHLLSHALVMGMGSSRAAGFGIIVVRIER